MFIYSLSSPQVVRCIRAVNVTLPFYPWKYTLPTAYSGLRCRPWFPVFQADEIWEHHCLILFCMLLPSCSRFSCCCISGLPVRTYLAHKYMQPRSVGELIPAAPPWTAGGENSSMTAFLFPPSDSSEMHFIDPLKIFGRSILTSFIALYLLPALISLPQYSFLELTLSSPLFLTLLSGKPRLNTSWIYLIHYSLLYNAVWTQLLFNWNVSIYYIKP